MATVFEVECEVRLGLLFSEDDDCVAVAGAVVPDLPPLLDDVDRRLADEALSCLISSWTFAAATKWKSSTRRNEDMSSR